MPVLMRASKKSGLMREGVGEMRERFVVLALLAEDVAELYSMTRLSRRDGERVREERDAIAPALRPARR